MAFKLSDNFGPLRKNWIKGAIKRPGAFRKKAEEAGMSTKAFAEKVIANKGDYSARTGRQAELAETLMGMNMNESPAKMHTDKHMRRQAEKKARKTQGDAQDIYYEMKSDKMEKEKKKGSPAKKVEPHGMYADQGLIKSYRKGDKHVAIDKSEHNTYKEERIASAKALAKAKAKANKGKSSPAKMKSPAKKDGKKGDLLSRGVDAAKKVVKKAAPVVLGGIGESVTKSVKKLKKVAKETNKLSGTGFPKGSPAHLKKGSPAKGYKSDAQRKAVHASKADGGKGAPSKLKKDSPAEANKFMAALQAAKDKGEKSFVVNGKSYNVTSKK